MIEMNQYTIKLETALDYNAVLEAVTKMKKKYLEETAKITAISQEV
jgi:hypothetical protein